MKVKRTLSNRNWMRSKHILKGLLIFFITGTINVWAQQKDKKTNRKAAQAHAEAQRANEKGDFYQAEAAYRKAISSKPEKMDPRYNLGSTYYDKEAYNEALMRFEEAAKLAEDKTSKHAAYHNLGNALMKNKEYRKAEQAFKEALRNDPADEETRYNYALAKELAKDEPEPPSEDSDTPEDQPDQDEDDEDDQDSEQDDGDNEEDKGEEDEQDGEPEDEEAEGQKDQQEVPQDGKISPEQMENLLNAMENAEKDLQKKLEDQKEKGKELNKDKYW